MIINLSKENFSLSLGKTKSVGSDTVAGVEMRKTVVRGVVLFKSSVQEKEKSCQ